jgi:lycopene beta-cyclase
MVGSGAMGQRAAYDHAIVGAGLSGLLLARALAARGPRGVGGGARVLLADPAPPDGQPVTFAHWARSATALDEWAIGAWDRLLVVGHDRRTRRVGLDGWTYTAIRWDRARAALAAELAADPRVDVVWAPVDAIRDGEDHAAVRIGGAWETARWVYDSRPAAPGAAGPQGARRGVALLQTFRGVWVQTSEDAIDTSAATLLDFSADDGPDLGFTYVLPVGPRLAMVMAVRMGELVGLPDPLPAVGRVTGRSLWEVVGEESGTTPLVTPAPPRRLGRRVLAIGRRGGRARPSTGYAVSRILADTAAIAASVDRHGHPMAVPPDPRWQRALDAIWMRALVRERAGLEPAFLALFAQAPIDRVLRFLDGGAGPRDVASVIRALPPGPFLRAAVEQAGRSIRG